MPYDHASIEQKWIKNWKDLGLYKFDENSSKEKKYILDMFPYPSGAGLHVGHVEGYTATDIYSRYMRMKGFNVLHPMGWDAFGLPAENYAVKTNIHPDITTNEAIKTFTSQINRLGLSYDWSRELATHKKEYYKWTQWLFLLLYKKGLAYKKEALANFCPSCQTVLANEQVVDGKCERCGAIVSQKLMNQWFFKITDYADRLINGLDKLDWPSSTKLAQVNWIGKSTGAELNFKVAKEGAFSLDSEDEYIKVFTTRPDTIYGCTFLVLAPEHKMVSKIVTDEKKVEVEKYLLEAKGKTELTRTTEKDKTGVFTGGFVYNPFNEEKIPVWISDFVISTYAEGALMAVPAHDERDHEFATKYSLPIIPVIKARVAKYLVVEKSLKPEKVIEMLKTWTFEIKEVSKSWGNIFTVNVPVEKEPEMINFLKDNLLETSDDGGAWYCDSMGTTNNILVKDKHFKINSNKDLEDFKAYERTKGIPEDQLDVKLKVFSDKDGILMNSDMYSGLSVQDAFEKMLKFADDEGFGEKKVQFRLRDWLISRQRYWGAPIPIIYDNDGNFMPVNEADLPVELPTDIDFKPTGISPLTYSKKFHEIDTSKYPNAVSREMDTMDTFVDSSWYFLRFCDPNNSSEFGSKEKMNKFGPVDLYMGGAEHTVLHLLYARFFTKVLFDEGLINFDEPFLKLRHQGMIIASDHTKMSKSKGNVINPDEICNTSGADTLRMYEMFMGPLDQSKAWSVDSVKGIRRFLQRVFDFSEKIDSNTTDVSVSENAEINILIKSVTEDIEAMKFNTAVSSFMKFINFAEAEGKICMSTWENYLILLAPFAPFLTEELWEKIGKKTSIHNELWTTHDESIISSRIQTIVVQVNGKKRALFDIKPETSEEEVYRLAFESIKDKVKESDVKKKFYVKGKIVSFVI
ncbi:MAG: class I tRNA ligase family protein [bacterium]